MSTSDISKEAIQAALAEIHASSGFRASPRMRELLAFLVESRLSGQNQT